MEDQLFGGPGDDRLIGHKDDDLLRGGRGSDTLTGGQGADRFVFRSSDFSGSEMTIDRIVDFDTDGDVLDFRGLGMASLSYGEGDLEQGVLWASEQGSHLKLLADLDGDGTADLDIILQNVDSITENDLLF